MRAVLPGHPPCGGSCGSDCATGAHWRRGGGAAQMNRWFARSWNPLHGCSRLCRGCDNCCALANLESQGRPGIPGVNYHILRKGIPDAAGVVQVCSLGDFFHEDYDDSVRDECLRKMLASRGNRFVVLTRRPGVAMNYFTGHRLPAAPANPNGGYGALWFGVSAECQDGLGRLDCLRAIPAPIHRVLALEPLLEPVDLAGRLEGIEWVIVGSESGRHRRPAKLE
ncbi:MAG: DUF5131 family protein, partial [Deltaproteobacteria bacterium]|nr:DUF5131 family protein [Deltaproteobacteria bacterium]